MHPVAIEFDWPLSGWTQQTTCNGPFLNAPTWTQSVRVERLEDGSYIACNARGQTDGMWAEGATPDEAVDGLVDVITGCAEVFSGRRP